jgi:basic amino acid/polyamine antiporter, APA family
VNESAGLKRELGLAAAAAAVAGEAIAVGIFLTPAGMAKSLGSPFWLLVVWLVMGAVSLSGALCFGELAGRYPQAGGLYVFLREAYGPRVAFLYGWQSLLVMDPGITAAMAVGMATYAAYIFGFSGVAIKVTAIATVALICGLNILNTKLSGRVLQVITVLKFAVLIAIVGWAIAFRVGSVQNFVPFVAQRPGSPALGGALAGALIAAFFSFGGWWDVSKLAGEVKNPAKTLPRALVLGVIAVTAVYILVSAVFIYVVPPERVTSDQTFVAQAGEVMFGKAGSDLLSATVVICVLGSLAALIMVCPRVYYAMARDGLFFHSVAETHPKFGTPAKAIAIQGVLACLLVLLGTFQQIIAYFIFVAVVFLGLTVLGLMRIRRRFGADGSVVLTPWYPVPPIVFLVLVVVLLFMLAYGNPLQTAVGCAVVAVGAIVYQLAFRGAPTRSRVVGEAD